MAWETATILGFAAFCLAALAIGFFVLRK